MKQLTRREFLWDSAALAGVLAGGGLADQGRAVNKETSHKGDLNDQIHVAVVGVNGRGLDHIKGFAGRNHCMVTTICDCDEGVIGRAMKSVEKAQGKAPHYEQDIRRMLEDKSIDVVSIATPNHWHSLAAIWAMQAGKDVYVEKPVSHNVSEGRRVVEAAQKYRRICQAGTQSRSASGMREAMAFLQAGKLGRVKVARGLCYKPRSSIGHVQGPQPIPQTIDYDLWSGPAPKEPLLRKHLHYDWHWFWDYGNGDLGNQGIHEMDICRWGLGKTQLPKQAISVGGRFGYVDDGQTANTQLCVYDYGDAELIFEVRGLHTDPQRGVKIGNIFHCEEGLLVCGGYNKAAALTPEGKPIKSFGGDGDHFGNFIEAVRSRKPESLHAHILDGHLSSALCHLGNISYRLGTMQPFNKDSKAFGDDKDAYNTLARMEEHLKDNKVAVEDTSYRVGRRLAFDPVAERFVNDKEADTYLTRDYRAPFVVPAKID